MRRSVRYGLAGLLALGGAAPAAADTPPVDLEPAVRAAMAETGARGVAIAQIADGKVVMVRAYGARDQFSGGLALGYTFWWGKR